MTLSCSSDKGCEVIISSDVDINPVLEKYPYDALVTLFCTDVKGSIVIIISGLQVSAKSNQDMDKPLLTLACSNYHFLVQNLFIIDGFQNPHNILIVILFCNLPSIVIVIVDNIGICLPGQQRGHK